MMQPQHSQKKGAKVCMTTHAVRRLAMRKVWRCDSSSCPRDVVRGNSGNEFVLCDDSGTKSTEQLAMSPTEAGRGAADIGGDGDGADDNDSDNDDDDEWKPFHGFSWLFAWKMGSFCVRDKSLLLAPFGILASSVLSLQIMKFGMGSSVLVVDVTSSGACIGTKTMHVPPLLLGTSARLLSRIDLIFPQSPLHEERRAMECVRD